MSYVFAWILLIAGSLAAGIGVFIWACTSGQFSDQGGARYLPLRGMERPDAPARDTRVPREAYALLALVTGAVGVLVWTLLLAFVNVKRG